MFGVQVEYTYDYDKVMYIIADRESKFQCQVWDTWTGCNTYGKYQVTDYLATTYGKGIPMNCEEQDEMMKKLIVFYESIIDMKKYEFTYHRGVFLTRTNLLIAMHFVPYGTIKYLETGEDYSNGLISVSEILKKYEDADCYKPVTKGFSLFDLKPKQTKVQKPLIAFTGLNSFFSWMVKPRTA